MLGFRNSCKGIFKSSSAGDISTVTVDFRFKTRPDTSQIRQPGGRSCLIGFISRVFGALDSVIVPDNMRNIDRHDEVAYKGAI